MGSHRSISLAQKTLNPGMIKIFTAVLLLSLILQEAVGQDFEVTPKKRFFGKCCKKAQQICNQPCNGKLCTAKCTVRCGFLGSTVCDPITCQVANPGGCTGGSGGSSSACESGYTEVGSKCYKVNTGPLNYLESLKSCISMGAELATVSSQTEQDAVFALTGSSGAWIGLTDFLDEGDFSWVDGTAFDETSSFNNWRSNAPNNGNGNQHCVQIRPDGEWDDVICNKAQAYVCQKAAN